MGTAESSLKKENICLPLILWVFKWERLNVGTVPTFKMHNVGTVPTFKTHHVGTIKNQNQL